MLKLKMKTDPRWVNIAEKNIEEILTDHAYCEQKAASYAISLIVQYPEYPDLVNAMADLSREEMEHFQRVHAIMQERGLSLGFERKDPYVKDLNNFFAGGANRRTSLIYKLLIAAMIEARSCERFRVLSENIHDEQLAKFYKELMASEAGHYTMFLRFAKEIGKGVTDVDKLWNDFLHYEGEIMMKYGKKEWIHG